MNRHFTVRLGDVAEINPKTPKGMADEEAVAFVPMAAVSEDGRLEKHGTRPFGEVKKGYSYFERGDVLVAKITPCFENGKATLTDGLREQIGFGSTEFHVLRPGQNLDARYLFYALWNDRFRVSAAKGMTGSAGQKRVPADLLRGTEIRLPPLDEQRRIAAILDKADALRQKRNRAIALLDSVVESVLDHAFCDESTSITLGDVFDVQGGLQLASSRKALPVMAPYLRVANVHRNRLDLAEIKTMRMTQAEFERTVLQAGDVLFVEGHGNADEIGRCAVWDGSIPACSHQNHLIRARPVAKFVDPVVVSRWLNTPAGRKHLLRRGKTTSGLNTISVSDVRTTPIPRLSIEKTSRVRAQLDDFQAHKSMMQSQLSRLDVLFTSLQHQAFSGQL